MPRNKENMLQMKLDVVAEHRKHYIEGVTTYMGVWRRWIKPRFYISYSYYMSILGEGGLERQLKEISGGDG